MRLEEIKDQVSWDGYVSSVAWNQFPQSWFWGEFQKQCGREVRRFALWENDQSVAVGQFVRYERYGISYWLAPRGPIFLKGYEARSEELVQVFVQQLAQQKLPGRILFYRVEPFVDTDSWRAAPTLFHRRAFNPSSTVLMDLTKSEEDLLAGLHSKTRYNMRLAERHGVTVRLGKTDEDWNIFFRLLQVTASRGEFVAQSEPYLRHMISVLSPLGIIRVRLAEYQGRALAADMEIVYGDTVTYLHGASSSEARNVMAPYILHWEAIKTAKSEGKAFYDFWGCNPENESSIDFKRSWHGITRFKEGFGGEKRTLIGTWDAPVIPWLYKMLPIGR